MSLPPLVFTFCALVLAIVGDGIAMFKPLVSLEGFYEFHLFPEHDKFDYTVSETHKASQAMHIMAFLFLIISLASCIGNMIMSNATGGDTSRVTRRLTILTTCFVTLSTACYAAALSTLIKIAMDYKHIADDIPLPTPKAEMETGSIMDIVGFIFVCFAFVSVMSAIVSSSRQGFVRLI